MTSEKIKYIRKNLKFFGEKISQWGQSALTECLTEIESLQKELAELKTFDEAKERAEFEAAGLLFQYENPTERYEQSHDEYPGEYKKLAVETAWQAWKAARS